MVDVVSGMTRRPRWSKVESQGTKGGMKLERGQSGVRLVGPAGLQ